jgi:hypothetical protein
MVRGLIVGAIAFAAAFAAERLFVSVKKDVDRYNDIRAMSGDPPLGKELFGSVGNMLTGTVRKSGSGVSGFFGGITDDVVRYAKLRSM